MPGLSIACLISQATSMGGCRSDQTDASGAAKAPPRPPAKPAGAPIRGAAGDADLRIMLAELASAKACEQIRGHFQALPAASRPEVMSGDLWIHGCRITNAGTKTKFHLEGSGWQWIDEHTKTAGATFALHQYVRFGVTATIAGMLDVGYDPGSHVASIWFSMRGDPEVHFTPIGKLDVDAEDVWSSVLGAATSLVANSPEASAKQDVVKQGAADFKKQFSEGISVTVDLCSGLTRSGLGHTPRGKMGAPGVGETRQIAVELQPGGLMIFGPQSASEGMTIEADVPKGTVHLVLACNDQAEALAKTFLEGRALPRGSVLAGRDVRGRATIRTGAARCPVSLVAELAPGASEAVTLNWRRPAAEAARSTGGPMIDCPEAAPTKAPAH